MKLAFASTALMTASIIAEPVAVRFPDLTAEVTLNDVDSRLPPLTLLEVTPVGGGAIDLGAGFEVLDESGNIACSHDLAAGSFLIGSGWLSGSVCDVTTPNFGVGLFGNEICKLCDWSEGWPSEVGFRSGVSAILVRYRPDVASEWTYGWIAYQATTLENLTCDPGCGGFGTELPFVNFIAAGFETEPGVPIATGVGLCPSDLNFDAVLDLTDLDLFVSGFTSNFDRGKSRADRNADGILDLADISIFVQDFQAGCN